MPGRLANKVALITGAGGGQGRAAAVLFAQEGAKVVATDIKVEGGHETVELVKAGRRTGRLSRDRCVARGRPPGCGGPGGRKLRRIAHHVQQRRSAA